MNEFGLAITPLPLAGFLGQNMAAESAVSANPTGSGHFEAFL
jgi:hypothetical protein